MNNLIFPTCWSRNDKFIFWPRYEPGTFRLPGGCSTNFCLFIVRNKKKLLKADNMTILRSKGDQVILLRFEGHQCDNFEVKGQPCDNFVVWRTTMWQLWGLRNDHVTILLYWVTYSLIKHSKNCAGKFCTIVSFTYPSAVSCLAGASKSQSIYGRGKNRDIQHAELSYSSECPSRNWTEAWSIGKSIGNHYIEKVIARKDWGFHRS